jgi:alkylation response protein AidB-like acyl-CoA dehydrogenase
MARVREAADSRRYDDALWQELVALGWPGIAVDERHGGQGLGAVELSVLLEELGYACAATPFLSTAAVASVLQTAGTERQRERWLPGLVSGDVRAGIGPRDLVLDGSDAEIVLLIEGDTATLSESFDAEPFDTIDPTRRFARVRGDGEGLGSDAAARFAVAVAAEVVGVCQRSLEMTLDYVKERKQFGVPVGSFQAVSHRCAQMLLHTESARSAAYFGAWAADADPSRLVEGAALAAAAAATGGREVAASAIQNHGGIGFTWEADVHWLYKRAELDRALLGSGARHHAALAKIAAQRLAAAAPA